MDGGAPGDCQVAAETVAGLDTRCFRLCLGGYVKKDRLSMRSDTWKRNWTFRRTGVRRVLPVTQQLCISSLHFWPPPTLGEPTNTPLTIAPSTAARRLERKGSLVVGAPALNLYQCRSHIQGQSLPDDASSSSSASRSLSCYRRLRRILR